MKWLSLISRASIATVAFLVSFIAMGVCFLAIDEYFNPVNEIDDSPIQGVFSIIFLSPVLLLFYYYAIKKTAIENQLFSGRHIKISAISSAVISLPLCFMFSRAVPNEIPFYFPLAIFAYLFITFQAGFSFNVIAVKTYFYTLSSQRIQQ